MLAITVDTHDFTLDLHVLDAVGLGTLLLALATFGLAWKTRTLAKEAEKDRQVAQRQVDTAQEQLAVAQLQADIARTQTQRSHRPVVVPFQRADEVHFRGGGFIANQPHLTENPRDRVDLPRYSAVHIAVENVGMGPALNLRGSFVGPHGSGSVRYPTEGLAAGHVGVVTFESWEESLSWTGDDAGFKAELLYDDVAAATYRTDIEFDVGDNAYRSGVAPPSGPAAGSDEPPRSLDRADSSSP